MSTARAYFEILPQTCVFHNWVRDGEGKTVSDTVCGQPAVAVYVSDDEEPKGRYVCQQHAEEAERAGDGPVFWPRDEEQRLRGVIADLQEEVKQAREEADRSHELANHNFTVASRHEIALRRALEGKTEGGV